MTTSLAFLDLTIPMAQRVAEHDWSSTPLGPIDTWPPVLKITVSLTLRSGFPKCLCWGSELIAIYNDAFIPTLGIARQSGRDARVNLDEILRRGVREGIILIVAGKMLARC